MLTLYQYLHCPFCLRADMVANYLNVLHKKVYLLNDDEDTCNRLIGKKMVPILEFDDKTTMAESKDIVMALQKISDNGKTLKEEDSPERYTDILSGVSFEMNALLFPRNIMLKQPEFEAQSARDYFQKKKENVIKMSFEEAYASSHQYIQSVELALSKLPALPIPNHLGWNDVLVFPFLRNLTMVKSLTMPKEIQHYVDAVATMCNIKTYEDVAV